MLEMIFAILFLSTLHALRAPFHTEKDMKISSFSLIHQFHHFNSTIFKRDADPSLVKQEISHGNEIVVSALDHHQIPLEKRNFMSLPDWITQGWPFYWTKQRIPDIRNTSTILSLAKLCSNVYDRENNFAWFDVTHNEYQVQSNFGWNEQGLRGYVFSEPLGNILVLAFKGTSNRLAPPEDTVEADRYMDNVMFSCCCGGNFFRQGVCSCQLEKHQCMTSCLQDSTKNNRYSYFNAAQKMYEQVKSNYPKATIWVVGHSLGGSLAALVGLANGVPAVAFEAPGELLFAQRIGLLPSHASSLELIQNAPIYHFGNVHDPIFMGNCKGFFSLCQLQGYFIETKCHLGKVCLYDEKRYHGNDSTNYRLKPMHVVDHVVDALMDESSQRTIYYHSASFFACKIF